MKMLAILLILAPTSLAFAAEPGEPGIEPLLGLAMDGTKIEFRVHDGGCTEPEDFRLDVLESDPPLLRLVRIERDSCEAYLPKGQTLHYRLGDLGVDDTMTFKVINPFRP